MSSSMMPPTTSRTHETDFGWLRIRTPSGETSTRRSPMAELVRASSTRAAMTPITGTGPSSTERAPMTSPLNDNRPRAGTQSRYPRMPRTAPARACSPASARVITRSRCADAPMSRNDDSRSSRRLADSFAAEEANVMRGSTSSTTAIVEVTR